jgi:hypothetical protein
LLAKPSYPSAHLKPAIPDIGSAYSISILSALVAWIERHRWLTYIGIDALKRKSRVSVALVIWRKRRK